MNLNEFITALKPMIEYKDGVHYMGSTILTNQELNGMLEILLEEEYTELNGTQREKVRERVFKELT